MRQYKTFSEKSYIFLKKQSKVILTKMNLFPSDAGNFIIFILILGIKLSVHLMIWSLIIFPCKIIDFILKIKRKHKYIETSVIIKNSQVGTVAGKNYGYQNSNYYEYVNTTNQQIVMAEFSKYNMENAKFGGGFAGDGGTQIGGILNDYSSNQNLSEAAAQIQHLITQLQAQGYSHEYAQQQVANDLAIQAQNDPQLMGKLVKWGQSLGDAAAKTTVTEAAKEALKLALRLSGIPIP